MFWPLVSLKVKWAATWIWPLYWRMTRGELSCAVGFKRNQYFPLSHESDICEGGKHQHVQRLHDSEQLWQWTHHHMVCSLSEYQRQQGPLHTEQEELLFQLCCSSLNVDERTSLFNLSSHRLVPSGFIYLLFFPEFSRTNQWNNRAPTWSCTELKVRMSWMFDKSSRFW